LNCLESEIRLAERLRETKLSPDYYHIALLPLDNDPHLSSFYQREENRVFLKSLDGLPDTLRLKGEGLMKFEYALLKERTKNLIVKDYLEGEIQAALADK